ncbi:hypothetical protein [Ideonella sp. YS5]|uniref:hypothetical protein n=1 Tax=Ideonella sp. YS5 TaxID=3453714 RepID=UPI003EEA0770
MANDKLQLDDKLLQAALGFVQNPADPLPAVLKAVAPEGPWDKLALRIGALPGQPGAAEIELPLLDEAAMVDRVSSAASAWQWSAGVQARAAVAIDLLAPEEAAALPAAPDGGHSVLAYSIHASLGGQLQGSVPISAWGQVGVGASGRRDVELRWYVQAPDDQRVVQALADAARRWALPFDLQALLRLAGDTDWRGMELALDGQAQIEWSAAAGRSVAGWTVGLDGSKAAIGLSVGVQAGGSFSRDSHFRLSALRERDPTRPADGAFGLRIKLHDEKLSTRSANFRLSATADFSAVTASAERALRAAWPALDSPLLDQLVQPGTAIAGQIQKLIDSHLDGDLAGLVSTLVGGTPPAGLREQLVGKLTSPLVDVLDRALGDIAAGRARVDRLVADWLARLLGPSASLTTVDDRITAAVNQALAQATEGLSGGIQKLETAITEAVGKPIDALLDRLGEFGLQLQKSLQALDGNPVSAAIADALDKYSTARDRLLAALGDAQKAKIDAALAIEQLSRHGSEAVVELWLRGGEMTPEAERLYHAICAGRLRALPELLAAGRTAGVVQDAKGWLLASAERTRTERVTLSFFGLAFESRTSLLSGLSLKADLITGNLLVATASASVETAISNPWKNRSARLGVAIAFERDEAGQGLVATSLDGAFTAQHEKSSRPVVQALLDNYCETVGAHRIDAAALLGAPPDSDKVASARFWRALTLAVPIALSAAEWRLFAGLDPALVRQTALQATLDAADRRYRHDSIISSTARGDLAQLAAEVLDRRKPTDADIGDYLALYPHAYINAFSAPDVAPRVGLQIAQVLGPLSRPTRRFLAFQRIAAVARAPSLLRELAAEAGRLLAAPDAGRDPVALRRQLEPLLLKMQQALSPVAVVSETWLAKGLAGADDEPIAWPFTCFLLTMARLVGRPIPPAFVPIAQVADGPPQPLLPTS